MRNGSPLINRARFKRDGAGTILGYSDNTVKGQEQAMQGWVIEGVREDGKRFRPGDWAERLAAQFARFGADHRLRYAPELKPGFINGEKCLLVNERLKQSEPEIFQFILDFAASNRLKISPVQSEMHDKAA
jgi:hypothetical protein